MEAGVEASIAAATEPVAAFVPAVAFAEIVAFVAVVGIAVTVPRLDGLAAAEVAAAAASLKHQALAALTALVVVAQVRVEAAVQKPVVQVAVVLVLVAGEEQVYGQVYEQAEMGNAPLHGEVSVSRVLMKDAVGAEMDVGGVHKENTCAEAHHTVENRRVDSSPMAKRASSLLGALPAWSFAGLCVPNDVLEDGDPDIRGSSRPVGRLRGALE